MTIQKSTWNRYIDVLAAIDRTAAKKFTAYLNTHDISSQAGRKAAIDYAAALADKYGESAAAMACEMYDAAAAASGVILPAAEPAATATYGEVAKTVNGMAKQNAGNDAMGSAIGRMVKRTGVDTTMKNAIRDGAQWAWIPSGDSCAFCLTLASRGWQRASKKALKNGHAEHIHSNCDCTYAVRFDSRSNVAGYDPDALYKQYQSAEGNTPQEKINSMRRKLYAENGDKIRAQKREAYEKKRISYKLPEALSMTYVNNADQLYKNLQNVKPISKYEDVAIHGVPGEAYVEHETTNGVLKRYSASDFADMIRENPDYHGGNVRLLSCGAGADETGFAQMLANELNKRVIAPTETLWVAENGEMFVSDSDVLAELWYNDGEIDQGIKQTGYWKVFDPVEKEVTL